MMVFPLKFALEVATPGEPVVDRFGNKKPGPASWRAVAVASWWVDRTEEGDPDSVLRTTDYLHAHMAPGDAPGPAGKMRTPDGRVWSVVGNAEDYSHGFHGWDPGLVVVHAKEVVG